MDRRSILTSVLSAACAIALLALAGPPQKQMGQWALQGAHPAVSAQLLAHFGPNRTVLDIAQYARGSKAPIGHYTVEMTQLMHLILVRDDFREFSHVHPNLHAGHFMIPVALAAGHRYYVYADSKPAGYGQQVFRFVLGAGAQPSTQRTTLAASHPVALAGPYSVKLSTTRLQPGRPQTIAVTITRGGKPAGDIHPYLGAAAHVVFINTSTLTYMHVHPMEASAMAKGDADSEMAMAMPGDPVEPKLMMHVPALSPRAAYKMWIQFQGGNTVYAAPYTIVASP